MMPAVPTVIDDRYVLDGVLARGGMADLYAARDSASGRPVAVKVLRAGTADPRKFANETRLLAMLQHRNVVRLLDAGHRGGVPFLVLERVEGHSLAQQLEQGPLPAADAARVGRDIAGALAHVHGHWVVHCTITPANILLADDGRALLSGFDAACLGGAWHSAPDGAAGTNAYLAPEQVVGTNVTAAADVYALGLVLIEGLTCRPAFPGSSAELHARLTRDPRIPAGLPDPWPDLLAAMTRRDPAARPDAAMVAAVLGSPEHSPVPGAVIDGDPTDPDLEVPHAAAGARGARAAAGATVGMDTADPTTAMAVDDPTQAMTVPAAVTGDDPTELDVVPPYGDGPRHVAPPTAVRKALDSPAFRPVLWLLAAFAALLVIALFTVGDTVGGGGDDDVAGRDAAGGEPVDAPDATTAPDATSTQSAPSTTAPSTSPASEPDSTAPSTPATTTAPAESADAPPADSCAALDARKAEIDATRQQLGATYRNDRETRDQVRAQLDAEKQAVEAQKQSLGC